MRLGEIGRGPLFPATGPTGKRVLRRVRGIVLSVLGFVGVTALLPLLLVGALLVDLYLKLTSGKPMVGVRLVLFLWWFLFNEIWTLFALTGVYLLTGGPFGKGSMRRRRGIYWLRPAWIGAVLAGLRVLFGIRFEIEGQEAAAQGRAVIMMRHASIIDNVLGDTQIAGPHGLGIRYVVKRELEALPLIDIGGRWITTNFVQRESGDARLRGREAETARAQGRAGGVDPDLPRGNPGHLEEDRPGEGDYPRATARYRPAR